MHEAQHNSLPRHLLLDLETTEQGSVLKIGAILGDRQLLRVGKFDFPSAVRELDRLAAAAECVVGHNLL